MRYPRDVQFPMPWGHMAGQEWGNPVSDKKVLATHGWMDNSNTFQKLFPLFPGDLHIVAVDFSGHGLSSHRGLGCSYTYLEFAIDLKRLSDQLGWESFALVGHSMGGMVGLLFCALFPEAVSHLVCLDIISIMDCPIQALAEISSWSVSNMLSFEAKNGSPPVYKDLDEVVERRLEITKTGSIGRDSVKTIMRRSIIDYQQGVVVRTDPRVKWCNTLNYSFEDQLEMLKRYKGRLLIVKAAAAMARVELGFPFDKFAAVFVENCDEFRAVVLKEAGHHVHLDEPDKVAPIIIDFLQNYSGAKVNPCDNPEETVGAKL